VRFDTLPDIGSHALEGEMAVQLRMSCIGVIAALAALGSPVQARKVHQEDLAAWVGVPVEALDTHSIFLTMPMVRTVTESGIEVRDYVNEQELSRCFGTGGAWGGNGRYVSGNAFGNCRTQKIGCHNIFYIKDGKVLEYAPTGRCYTDKTVRPQERYRAMTAK
jgi:hypothetical protein